MIRSISIALAFLLVTSSTALAEDREPALLNLGHEYRYQHKTDMHMSPREYEEITSHNRKFVLKNLRSYSENALELAGMPEQGINLMGAALGVVFNDSKLHLNKSRTLALELKDVRDSDRTLYFGVNLDW